VPAFLLHGATGTDVLQVGACPEAGTAGSDRGRGHLQADPVGDAADAEVPLDGLSRPAARTAVDPKVIYG